MELYIHIPFCARKCTYCAFDSFPGCTREEMSLYMQTLLQEAEIRKAEITEPVHTIYIGGGTPSLIPVDVMKSFLAKLDELIDFSSLNEFTVEANPGTVTASWLKAVTQSGVNRISFGMQSSQPDLLRTLGRIHSMADVTLAVQLAREHSIPHINLDLIFGIPGQTMDDWNETIQAALALEPDHISAYGLIPEYGTPLFDKLESNILSLPEPDLEREMYDLAISRFRDAGLFQYEISNFAKEGCECRHNIGYWDQIPYLGLGLSAASMELNRNPAEKWFCFRRSNPRSFEKYYRMVNDPEMSGAETEFISAEDARFETVMLSLRMNQGMKRSRFHQLHGFYPEHFYGDTLFRLQQEGLLLLNNDAWCLTRRGMDIQNTILLEFMK